MIPTNTISLTYDMIDESSLVEPMMRDIQAEYALSLMHQYLSDKEKHVLIQRIYKNRTYEAISSDSIFEKKVHLSNVKRIYQNSIRKMQIQVIMDATQLKNHEVVNHMQGRLKKYIGKGYKTG